MYMYNNVNDHLSFLYDIRPLILLSGIFLVLHRMLNILSIAC